MHVPGHGQSAHTIGRVVAEQLASGIVGKQEVFAVVHRDCYGRKLYKLPVSLPAFLQFSFVAAAPEEGSSHDGEEQNGSAEKKNGVERPIETQTTETEWKRVEKSRVY